MHEGLDAQAIEAHLGGCETCTAVVDELRVPAEPLPFGDGDRYLVARLIGVGASAKVYLAHDRVLQREVALKVHHWSDAESPAVRARVLDEARALARVSHPNVVPVFDCFETQDRLVLVMPLVEGESLRRALARGAITDPSRALLAVGHGLAAVHAAGLVHGDVKPDNVLVGDDGRVLLADLGLATLTAEGRARGFTPAYAAPEVHRGEPATPRSDQFAFCVLATEALTGDRATLAEVPAPWRQPLATGRADAPDDRFPSMEALLDELERPWWRPKHPVRWLAALGVVLLGLGGALVHLQRKDAACRAAAGQAAEVWAPAVRGALEQAFVAAAPHDAPGAFAAFDRAAQAFAQSWRDESLAACRADVRADSPRTECLREQLATFEAVIAGARAPSARAVLDAPWAARSLPTPGRCRAAAEAGTLGHSEAVELTARAAAALQASKLPEAKTTLEQALARARTDARPDLEAKVELLLGQVVAQTDGRAAEGHFTRAATLAQRVQHDETLAAAWRQLARLSRVAGRYDEAEKWLSLAEALGTRAGLKGELAVQAERAQWLVVRGRRDDALALARQVVARAIQTFGEGALETLEHRWGEMRLEFAAGHYQGTIDLAGPLLAAYRQQLGPRHYMVGKVVELQAAALVMLNHFDQAEPLLDEAAQVVTANFGDAAAQMVPVLGNRAAAEGALERYDEALAHAERARALSLAHHGQAHPLTAWVTDTHAYLLGRAGRLSDALEVQRTLVDDERARGVESPTHLSSFARLLAAAGRHQEARAVLSPARLEAGADERQRFALAMADAVLRVLAGERLKPEGAAAMTQDFEGLEPHDACVRAWLLAALAGADRAAKVAEAEALFQAFSRPSPELRQLRDRVRALQK